MSANFEKQQKISDIIETKTITEIKQKIQSLAGKTLFIFDFDNVIAWLGEEFLIGTDHWFRKTLHELHAKHGGNLEDAEIATLKFFEQTHIENTIKAVESDTIDLIRELHQKNECVITLTARDKYLANLTRTQANALGICFSNSEKFKSRCVDLSHISPNCHIEDGYFFTGGHCKGTILKIGLEQLQISLSHYNQVVFIDDDLKRVKQVQEALQQVIDFHGFRYGFLDDHIERINALAVL